MTFELKEIAELKELVDKQTSELMTRFFKIKRLEEQNKSLGERVLQLEKDKGKLIDELVESKAQIEKMKCCGNCKHNNYTYWQSHCNNPKVKICKLLMQKEEVICSNYNKWEFAE